VIVRTPRAGILERMRCVIVVAAALALISAWTFGGAGAGLAGAVDADTPVKTPRDRVEHHLHEAQTLAQHFESVLSADCPRFASPTEWQSYFDGEVDRVVLLMAHLDQAWAEAKQTPDKDVRRAAKAPRRDKERGRQLLDKLQQCAGDNGASFAPMVVWQRIERELPRRQAQIALP